MRSISPQLLRNNYFNQAIQRLIALWARRLKHTGLAGIGAFAGAVVYAIGRFMVSANNAISLLLISAGFLLALGGGLYWWQSWIRKRPLKEQRRALWAAWWTAAIAYGSVAGGIILHTVDERTGMVIAGFGLLVLILGSPCIYFMVSRAPSLGVRGAANSLAVTILLAGFVLGFSAAVILLITGDPPAYWIGPQTNSPIESSLIVSVPFLLVLCPIEISASRTWKCVAKETRKELPKFLANLASVVTILYAVTLHFLSGPLKNTSVDKLAVAILSVVVLLRPFYRSIAEQCLKEGPAKALTLHEWRKAQRSVLSAVRHLIRDGDSAVIEDSAKDE